MRRGRGMGLVSWAATGMALMIMAGAGVWQWAVRTGSAAPLNWIDAAFPRDRRARLAATAGYGAHPAQRLELWVPHGESGNRPLIVFYHGGGWHTGAPRDYRFVARTFAEHGFATALVGYRLVPDGRFPAMLQDSAAALAWLARNAAGHGVSGQKVILAGHSAGAYNAVMLALDPQWLRDAGVPDTMVAGAAGLAGPYDFYPFTTDSARAALGHAEPPDRTQPIRFVRSDAPPLLLITGADDDVVKPRNSAALAAALQMAGGEAELVIIPAMGHAGIIMALSKPFARDAAVASQVADFARTRLAQPTSGAVQDRLR
ncbi:alpha/beta hydrolase [Porphyrobacter sp. GA68]|uniref:alpha/beta hydrolase n=1 Tax=Porphyrobacter sp. GA68 TaxID=2883480 RepID=UPI001D17E7D3|nr:alpha/beta hydrolase [Porphyrobacter sp. GA68]